MGTSESKVIPRSTLHGHNYYLEFKYVWNDWSLLNHCTTDTPWGRLMLTIYDDPFMRCSAYGNQVYVHKDTTTSGKLDVGSGVSSSVTEVHST